MGGVVEEANQPARDLSRMERFRETLSAGQDVNAVAPDQAGPTYNPHAVTEKNIDALWPFVSQILGIVQQHDQISRYAVKMVLTRRREDTKAGRV